MMSTLSLLMSPTRSGAGAPTGLARAPAILQPVGATTADDAPAFVFLLRFGPFSCRNLGHGIELLSLSLPQDSARSSKPLHHPLAPRSAPLARLAHDHLTRQPETRCHSPPTPKTSCHAAVTAIAASGCTPRTPGRSSSSKRRMRKNTGRMGSSETKTNVHTSSRMGACDSATPQLRWPPRPRTIVGARETAVSFRYLSLTFGRLAPSGDAA